MQNKKIKCKYADRHNQKRQQQPKFWRGGSVTPAKIVIGSVLLSLLIVSVCVFAFYFFILYFFCFFFFTCQEAPFALPGDRPYEKPRQNHPHKKQQLKQFTKFKIILILNFLNE